MARPLRQMTGAANFNEVFLSDVRVPDDARIGEVGDGWRVVITTFMFERTSVVTLGASVADAFMGLLARYEPPPILAIAIASSSAWVAGKALGYTQLRMMTALGPGPNPGTEGSLGKLVGTLLLTDIYDQAIELLGAEGLLAGDDAPSRRRLAGRFSGDAGPADRRRNRSDPAQHHCRADSGAAQGSAGDMNALRVITIFPEFFASPLQISIVARAIESGALCSRVGRPARVTAKGRHRQVDDAPFGGGPGMVMMIEPLDRAPRRIGLAHRVLLTPAGKPPRPGDSRALGGACRVDVVCGRYEGVDERVAEHLVDEEVSLGDFVLAGGEVAAAAIIEGIARSASGSASGTPSRSRHESFSARPARGTAIHPARPRTEGGRCRRFSCPVTMAGSRPGDRSSGCTGPPPGDPTLADGEPTRP